MSLTRRVYGGKKSRNSKKGRGHCRIGGKKTLKKGGKRVLSLGGKSLKNRKKSKRRSKGGAGYGGELYGQFGANTSAIYPIHLITDVGAITMANRSHTSSADGGPANNIETREVAINDWPPDDGGLILDDGGLIFDDGALIFNDGGLAFSLDNL